MINAIRSPFRQRTVVAILLTGCFLLITMSQSLSAATHRVFSGATILAADRADLALNTGLWRGEFLKVQEEEESSVPGTSVDESPQSLQAMRAAEVRQKVDIVNLEEAAEEYFEDGNDVPVESNSDEILVTDDVPEHMSDWEQAICNVSDGKGLAAGQKGPSMITAVVAVVGLIVVIGAYLKK
jgi:hypothetical protein